LFDRESVYEHKNCSDLNNPDFDYLREEISNNIIERLQIIARTFPNTFEIGSGKGYIGLLFL
jgi:hypothetical protein